MKIDNLKPNANTEGNKKLEKAHKCLQGLIDALNKKDLPTDISTKINRDIDTINAFSGTDKELTKAMSIAKKTILKEVMQKLKLVPKNHYRNMWMALGMSVFGIPMGVTFSVSLKNYGFIGIGLPIGMAIGIALGTGMDKKAEKEGRRLDVEV